VRPDFSCIFPSKFSDLHFYGSEERNARQAKPGKDLPSASLLTASEKQLKCDSVDICRLLLHEEYTPSRKERLAHPQAAYRCRRRVAQTYHYAKSSILAILRGVLCSSLSLPWEPLRPKGAASLDSAASLGYLVVGCQLAAGHRTI